MTARSALPLALIAILGPASVAYAEGAGLAAPTAAPSALAPSAASAAPPPAAPPPALAAPAASAGPAAPPPGPAFDVEFVSDRRDVHVFVAPGRVDPAASLWPDPFKNVGVTPVRATLPPGDYTVHVEGRGVTEGTLLITVADRPLHVQVHGGNDETRSLSTLLVAVGASALLAGAAWELSYSQAPNGVSKSTVAIPLFVTGAVGVTTGLILRATSSTSFDQDGPGPRAGLSLSSVW